MKNVGIDCTGCQYDRAKIRPQVCLWYVKEVLCMAGVSLRSEISREAKRVTIRITDDMLTYLKKEVVDKGMTVQGYLLRLIEKDMKRKK